MHLITLTSGPRSSKLDIHRKCFLGSHCKITVTFFQKILQLYCKTEELNNFSFDDDTDCAD